MGHDKMCPAVPLMREDGTIAFYTGLCACDLITDVRADQDALSRVDERAKASLRVLALPWEPHGVMRTPYVDRERAAAAAGGDA